MPINLNEFTTTARYYANNIYTTTNSNINFIVKDEIEQELKNKLEPYIRSIYDTESNKVKAYKAYVNQSHEIHFTIVMEIGTAILHVASIREIEEFEI